MKLKFSILTIILTLAACSAPQAEQKAVALDTEIKKGSYYAGFDMVERMVGQFSGALDEEAFLAGVTDRLADKGSQVTEAEIEAAVNALVQARSQLAAAAAAESAAEGLAFLEENGQREGVITLESGLQYEVLTEGEGAKPSAADSVTTHYEGRLIDETVFDSSYQRGEPATFPLNGVIKGWTEALQLMPVGSKWRLYLPPQIAYGERGAPPSIPPNATLVFDVELLEIVGQTD